jgi:hypothetical protein
MMSQTGKPPERALTPWISLRLPVVEGVRVGICRPVAEVGDGDSGDERTGLSGSGVVSGEVVHSSGDAVGEGVVCAAPDVCVGRGVAVARSGTRVGRGVGLGVCVGRGVRVGVGVLPGGTGVQAPLTLRAMVSSS